MIKTFTQNDLVRYIYRETSHEETQEIESAILFDEALAEELSTMQQTVTLLDAAKKKPSAKSIDRILSYSRSYDLHAVK